MDEVNPVPLDTIFAAIRVANAYPARILGPLMHMATRWPVITMCDQFTARVMPKESLGGEGIQGLTLDQLLAFCATHQRAAFILSTGGPAMLIVCFQRGPDMVTHLLTEQTPTVPLPKMDHAHLLRCPPLLLPSKPPIEGFAVARCAMLTLALLHVEDHALALQKAHDLALSLPTFNISLLPIMNAVSRAAPLMVDAVLEDTGHKNFCRFYRLRFGALKGPSTALHVFHAFDGAFARTCASGMQYSFTMLGQSQKLETLAENHQALNLKRSRDNNLLLLEMPSGLCTYPYRPTDTLREVLLKLSLALRTAHMHPEHFPTTVSKTKPLDLLGSNCLCINGIPLTFATRALPFVAKVRALVHAEAFKHFGNARISSLIADYAASSREPLLPNAHFDKQRLLNTPMQHHAQMYRSSYPGFEIVLSAAATQEAIHQLRRHDSPVFTRRPVLVQVPPPGPRYARKRQHKSMLGKLTLNMFTAGTGVIQPPLRRLLGAAIANAAVRIVLVIRDPSNAKVYGCVRFSGTVRTHTLITAFWSDVELLHAALRVFVTEIGGGSKENFAKLMKCTDFALKTSAKDLLRYHGPTDVDPLDTADTAWLSVIKVALCLEHFHNPIMFPQPMTMGELIRTKAAKTIVQMTLFDNKLCPLTKGVAVGIGNLVVNDLLEPVTPEHVRALLASPNSVPDDVLTVQDIPPHLDFLNDLLQCSADVEQSIVGGVHVNLWDTHASNPSIQTDPSKIKHSAMIQAFTPKHWNPEAVHWMWAQRSTMKLWHGGDKAASFSFEDGTQFPPSGIVGKYSVFHKDRELGAIMNEIYNNAAKAAVKHLQATPAAGKLCVPGPDRLFEGTVLAPDNDIAGRFMIDNQVRWLDEIDEKSCIGELPADAGRVLQLYHALPPCIGKSVCKPRANLFVSEHMSLPGILAAVFLRVKICRCKECSDLFKHKHELFAYNAEHYKDYSHHRQEMPNSATVYTIQNGRLHKDQTQFYRARWIDLLEHDLKRFRPFWQDQTYVDMNSEYVGTLVDHLSHTVMSTPMMPALKLDDPALAKLRARPVLVIDGRFNFCVPVRPRMRWVDLNQDATIVTTKSLKMAADSGEANATTQSMQLSVADPVAGSRKRKAL